MRAKVDLINPERVRRARKVDIRSDFSTAEAAQAMLAECGAQVSENAEIVSEVDSPVGVHQLRVGLRRFRSVAMIFKDLPGQEDLADLANEAKLLGRVLSPLRDIEILQSIFLQPIQSRASDEPGIVLLSELLDESKVKATTEVRSALNTQRTQSFVTAIKSPEIVAARLKPVPIMELAPQSLDKIWQKVLRRAEDIQDHDPDQRHHHRKALKGLRYAVDFLGPVYSGNHVVAFSGALKALQEVLGQLNDLSTVKTLFSANGSGFAGHPDIANATSLILDDVVSSETALQTAAIQGWQHLNACAPFWEGRGLVSPLDE